MKAAQKAAREQKLRAQRINQAAKAPHEERLMSIYSAMRAGVTGLNANASAMAVISDNIANLNTVGYKRGQSDFTAMVNAQNADTTYNAGGVIASTRRLVSLQGSINQTASPTDLAISGDGFFIVTEDSSATQGAGGGLFTRAG